MVAKNYFPSYREYGGIVLQKSSPACEKFSLYCEESSLKLQSKCVVVAKKLSNSLHDVTESYFAKECISLFTKAISTLSI